jgi:hypothetical protein
MIAKYIRFTDSSKEPGWVGLVVGHDMTDLFWTIDEMGDPYSCHLKSIEDRGCAICFKVKYDNDSPEGVEPDYLLMADHEDDKFDCGESLWHAISDDAGWKAPDWGPLNILIGEE